MRYGTLFALLSLTLASVAVINGGWFWFLMWPSVSCGIVSLGYLRLGPKVYGKSDRGMLSPLNQATLLPFLLYLWCVWNLLRLLKREPPFDQLTHNIFIGRRLLSHELPDHITHVIDLTCEFSEPKTLRARSYHCFQILDASSPSLEALHDWIDTVGQLSGNIYIHCAEGHGRTGLFASALLLSTGIAKTPAEALQLVRSTRPRVRLGRRQLSVLNAMNKTE